MACTNAEIERGERGKRFFPPTKNIGTREGKRSEPIPNHLLHILKIIQKDGLETQPSRQQIVLSWERAYIQFVPIIHR